MITGLSYIDDQALDDIRRKADGFVGELQRLTLSLSKRVEELEERVSRLEKLIGISELVFPLTHECVKLMLLSMDKQLGFSVYTADPSKTCGNVGLSDLANMDKNALSRYAGLEVFRTAK